MVDPAAAWKKRVAPAAAGEAPEREWPAAPCEIELKLAVRPQDFERVRGRLDELGTARRRRRIDNVYFDTPELRLAAARAALRLRSVRAGRQVRWLQTLKTEDEGAALSRRGEWETPTAAGAIEPARLAGTPLERLLGAAPGPLRPQFRTRFERTTWRIERHGAHVEAALDRGRVEAGPAGEPICELELELLDGPRSSLLDIALELCGATARRRADIGLLPSVESKAARGYRLAQGAAPTPVAPPPAPARQVLGARLGAAIVVRRWAGLQMNALLANVGGIGSCADIEFVHQARVALRRLRSGLDLLAHGRDLPGDVARGLKHWSERLGEVRDWDVFCSQQLPMLIEHASEPGAGPWLRLGAAAARRQAQARARLRRQLEEPAFAEFALRMLRWSLGDPERPGKRLGDAAPKLLRERLERLAASARDFARLNEARQHKLRIEAKRLRYATEMVRVVLPKRGLRARLRALSRFQKAAGGARDCLQAQQMVERLSRSTAVVESCRMWCRERFVVEAAKAQRLAADLAETAR